MGNVAKTDISLNYDIFMLDYRGYGKSEGKIRSLNQSFEDNQMIFNEFKKKISRKGYYNFSTLNWNGTCLKIGIG